MPTHKNNPKIRCVTISLHYGALLCDVHCNMCIALVHQGVIQIKNGSTTQLCIHVACVSVHYHNTRLFFWKPATAFIWKQWSFCRNTMLSILAPVGGSVVYGSAYHTAPIFPLTELYLKCTRVHIIHVTV